MRARSVRLSILILIILVISTATLGFKDINIDIPGFELSRGGTGPLGLRLGLDLRGGAHLVYQADTGTTIKATFTEELNNQITQEVIDGMGFSTNEVTFPEPMQVIIQVPALNAEQLIELREVLELQYGEAEVFDVDETAPPTSEQMIGVLDIISRRVNLFGTEEPIVQRFGDDRILVQLPGASGSVVEVEFNAPTTLEDLDLVLGSQGLERYTVETRSDRSYKVRTASLGPDQRVDLQTSLIDSIGDIHSFQVTGGVEDAKSLIGQTARLEFKERTCDTALCLNFTDAEIGLTGDDLSDAFASTSQSTGEWQVNIQFDGRGSDIFGEMTRRIAYVETKPIAVILDDEDIIAPVARAWIRNVQSAITGRFTREEAVTFSIQLDSGRLPVPLKLIQESDVDALLGSDSLRSSLLAGLIGLGLVIVFMLVYYRAAGIVASLALIFYAVVTLAIFKLIPITLTLSHIGGFILSIGLAVDANILIFERMKEEIRIGRTLASSMEVGFNRAWPAIRDGNFSTLITCGVLLWFGNRLGGGLINGFALSLMIGVLVSMFTAVVLSRNLLQLMAWIGLGQRLNLFTPEKVTRQTRTGTRSQATEGSR